jgi:hypothetical protein
MRNAALFTLALVGCVPGMQNRWAQWGVSWTGVAEPTSVATPVPVGAVTTNTVAPTNNLVVYVHGGGGRILGGNPSDAPRWVSSTVAYHGLAYADFPAFEGSQDEWRYMMSCSQNYFAGFPITLVDQQPTSGDYLLAVVSGSMSVFNTNAWGEADTGVGGIVERGTGFVFSADHRTDHRAQRICETLTHEIGHMLGLNHVDQCQDIMSANAGCVWDGARPGFLDHNRQVLATHLAKYGQTVQAPEPARIVDFRALDVMKLSDGSSAWPVNATANRPLARAVTYRRYEDGTQTEWPCSVNGNGCDIVDSTARSLHIITPGSTTQVKIVVFFEDGTSQETGWATITWGG